jgi:hypothetical protein
MLAKLLRNYHYAVEISATTPAKVRLPVPGKAEFTMLPDETVKGFK